MVDVRFDDFERLAKSYEQLSAHVIALTAVVGAMVTTSTVDFERLEECVHFAAKQLHPGGRSVLFAKASSILEGFEVMRRALCMEVGKIRTFKRAASKR